MAASPGAFKREYEARLAAAGFAEVSVASTHPVGDGLPSAIIKVPKPQYRLGDHGHRPWVSRTTLPMVSDSCC